MIPGWFFLAKQHIALFYWWPPPWLVLEHRQELQPPNTSNLVMVFQFQLLWLFNATFCWIPWSEYQNTEYPFSHFQKSYNNHMLPRNFWMDFQPGRLSFLWYTSCHRHPQARPLSEAASPSVALKGRYLTAPALDSGWVDPCTTGH